MANFEVNILGCGSATPSLRHLPACQVVDFRDNLMMIDCGEGAQLGMRRQRLKYSRLGHIFISHLHGDHFFGLPGLLSTLALHGKTGTVTVHIFEQGAEWLKRTMDSFCTDRPYELEYDIIKPEHRVILDTKSLTVETFPLYHRVPAAGFILREKPKLRHLRGDMAKFYNIPVSQLHGIKEGADFVTPDGTVVANERLTTPADPSHSYAYCSDTIFDERVGESVRGVETIYHEATYIDANKEKAASRFHSTASQAAMTAREAGARRLILGHYSKSYPDESQHLAEARAIFPDTIAATEGLRIDLTELPAD